MSRVYRTQKEYEQFLIRTYCTLLHYEISSPRWPDPPDAVLTLRKGQDKKRVAIEHTSYFNDTEAGIRSPLTPLAEFWKHVETSLCRRISHRKQLADIVSCRILLKTNRGVRGNDIELARRFAGELVRFMEARPFAEEERIPQCHSPPSVRAFSGFPTLESMVSDIRLRRIRGGVFRPRCHWRCSNITAGCIGLNLEYIKSAINKKNAKAAKYNWMSANEKWLLIVAAGETLSNNAGPPDQEVKWNDPVLCDSCRISPFDKIVFWEYARNWYKSLKPIGPTVRYNSD